MSNYKLGTDDPKITPDAGSGVWNSESWTFEAVAEKQFILAHLYPNAAGIIGPHAAEHMNHYFANNGKTLTIDLDSMLAKVPSAKTLYDTELSEARTFVETLPDGTHQIASAKARNGYDTKAESWDWFYAVGGYSEWGKGEATVAKDASGKLGYRLKFEYRFYDRYNWDGGKKVTIFGIEVTDAFMQRFHRQGLAQEYDMVGSHTETVRWGSADAIPKAPWYSTGDRE